VKAVIYQKYGSPDVLEFAEVATPVPEEDEVLVKVRAASVNSWDRDLLKGTPFVNRLMHGLLNPHVTILGCDIAGQVESVGRNATHFQPGDEVFGDISGCGWGGFAEYVCARENVLALKPTSMTFEEAAAVPQAAVLALQSFYYCGDIHPGKEVLLNGAGGGVGTFALQIAKSFGAEVTSVDSAGKLDMLRSLGSDHVIDYTQEDFTKNGQRYDLIIDVVGTRSVSEYMRALSPTGTCVMVGGSTHRIFQMMFLGSWISMTSQRRMGVLLHRPNKKDLHTMNKLFEAGTVVPVIDRLYPLSEVAEALRYFGMGDVKGKVVITV